MNRNCIQELHGQIGGTGESAPPTGSRIFSKGELAENVAKGDIVSVTGYLAKKTADLDYPYTSDGSVNQVAISGDGNFMAIANNVSTAPAYVKTYKWSATNNRYERTAAANVLPTSSANACCLSDDGLFLIVTHASTTAPAYIKTYKWVAANNRYEQTAFPDVAPTVATKSCAVSSDGSYLVIVSVNAPRVISYKWVEANNRYEQTAAPDASPTSGVTTVSMSSDGAKLFMTTSSTPYVYSYKWVGANNRYEATAAPYSEYALAGSPTSACMAASGLRVIVGASSSDYDHRIRLYEWVEANNRYEHTTDSDYAPHASLVLYRVSVSRDGSMLFAVGSSTLGTVGGDSGAVYCFRWISANNRYELTAPPDIMPGLGSIYACATNSDGTRFVTANSTASPYFVVYNVPAAATYYTQKLASPRILPPWAEAFVGYANTAGTTGQKVPLTAISWTRKCYENDLDPA